MVFNFEFDQEFDLIFIKSLSRGQVCSDIYSFLNLIVPTNMKTKKNWLIPSLFNPYVLCTSSFSYIINWIKCIYLVRK